MQNSVFLLQRVAKCVYFDMDCQFTEVVINFARNPTSYLEIIERMSNVVMF